MPVRISCSARQQLYQARRLIPLSNIFYTQAEWCKLLISSRECTLNIVGRCFIISAKKDTHNGWGSICIWSPTKIFCTHIRVLVFSLCMFSRVRKNPDIRLQSLNLIFLQHQCDYGKDSHLWWRLPSQPVDNPACKNHSRATQILEVRALEKFTRWEQRQVWN